MAECKIIPWLEVNAPDFPCAEVGFQGAFVDALQGEKCLQFALRGLREFKANDHSIDECILTTTRSNIHHFDSAHVGASALGLRLIGGLKTDESMPKLGGKDGDPLDDWINPAPITDFASEAGWRDLALRAREVRRLTHTDTVLFENEPTLINLWQQCRTDELELFLEGLLLRLKGNSLVPLAKSGVKPLFWVPWVMYPNAGVEWRGEFTKRLVRVLADSLPTARFIINYTSWGTNSLDDNSRQEFNREMYREMRRQVGPERIIEIIYVTEDDGNYITPTGLRRVYNVREAQEYLSRRSGTFIIYPGVRNWIRVADMWYR